MLYSHFLDGVQHHPIGHPSSPNDYLQRGELRSVFCSGDAEFEVLVDDEESTLPDGRPMANFLARRTR